MSQPAVAKLYELALKFRQAIEQSDRTRLSLDFRSFPRGSCGDTSLLLGQFLADRGCGAFSYVLGRRDGCSHAWLQQGAVIVDITADQFDDFDSPVFVAEFSPWHETFSSASEHHANISVFGPQWEMPLRGHYRYLCSLIQAP